MQLADRMRGQFWISRWHVAYHAASYNQGQPAQLLASLLVLG